MNARPMLTVREALDFLMGAARPVTATETVSTLEANGRVLTEGHKDEVSANPQVQQIYLGVAAD